MLDHDKVLGTLLGSAVGDALGMPIDGLSHQNVRTYYKGIKGYRADEHRGGLEAGQWTSLTQRSFALVRVLADPMPHGAIPTSRERYADEVARLDLRRPSADREASSEAVVIATPLALWWASEGRTSDEVIELVASALGDDYDSVVLAAAVGHALAVQHLLAHMPAGLDGAGLFRAVTEVTTQAEERFGARPDVSDRLRLLAGHLDAFPLDLQDLCDGTGAATDEAWPFALAMVARNPTLLEATMLPAINVGGAASTVGALVGAMLGALHGWAAFPEAWREGLENVKRLEAEARAFGDALAESR